jgi:hypothetical protein
VIAQPNDWRAAGLATLVQVLLMLIAVVGIGLFTESLARANYPVDTFNNLVRWAFAVGSLATIVGTIVVPWASLRRTPKRWPPSVLRAAPFLGAASLVGSVVGFAMCGVGANVFLEAVSGPIPHNSLLEIPMVGLSLIGLLTGSIIGGVLAIMASKKGVA